MIGIRALLLEFLGVLLDNASCRVEFVGIHSSWALELITICHSGNALFVSWGDLFSEDSNEVPDISLNLNSGVEIIVIINSIANYSCKNSNSI